MSSNEAVGEAVSDELTALLARLGELADLPTDPVADGGVALVDQIACLERLRGAVAAAQHTAMVTFARSQVELQATQVAAGQLDPRAVGRGIGDQIGLAAHVSPHVGSRRLGVARTLAEDLPVVRGLLVAGRISEHLAEHVVAQTSHLEPEQRRLVDKHLADTELEHQGRREAEATVKKTAYEIDRAGYVNRGRTARTDRRVTLRPAPDTMSVLSGLLPVEQGVACLAALRKHADSLIATGAAGDRTRDQIVADTLVERITGQARATDVSVELEIVLPIDALLDPESDTPGELVGHGPMPADIIADILATTQGTTWWRRLFAHPKTGCIVGGESKQRFFDGLLAKLIDIRDHGRCRDPYCDAPRRHRDHIRPARDDGPTSLVNARAECARGNQVKEMPGWHHRVVHDGLGDHPHTVETTTPTGHTYTSRAGP
ncbi:DUF222 domain-containing protein [Actinomycetospora atypica]|uniref:DUF222 domain-containing protein n=1 Tax=Actinomycetospora atypica TaxID=1290095 RepID=A0ABV9YQQ0_9PSEU